LRHARALLQKAASWAAVCRSGERERDRAARRVCPAPIAPGRGGGRTTDVCGDAIDAGQTASGSDRRGHLRDDPLRPLRGPVCRLLPLVGAERCRTARAQPRSASPLPAATRRRRRRRGTDRRALMVFHANLPLQRNTNRVAGLPSRGNQAPRLRLRRNPGAAGASSVRRAKLCHLLHPGSLTGAAGYATVVPRRAAAYATGRSHGGSSCRLSSRKALTYGKSSA
jgi:hypothetical protein